jgi:hypothetical protein
MPQTTSSRPFQFRIVDLMGLTVGAAVFALFIRTGLGSLFLLILAVAIILARLDHQRNC